MTRLRCGAEVFEPRVRAAGDGFEVTLAGRSLRLAVERVSDGVFRVTGGGPARLLHVARAGGRIHVFWDGVVYTLDEEREGARAIHRHDGAGLEAPMPGRVTAVKVQAGADVRKGQELLLVEAMKMENALRAPRDGRVRALHAAVGDMVAPGRVLVELEP